MIIDIEDLFISKTNSMNPNLMLSFQNNFYKMTNYFGKCCDY